MVIYTIKNFLPVKDILKTLPSRSINNYIKNSRRQRSRETAVKEQSIMKKDKIVPKKVHPVLYL